ncbi:MAG: hypothetical protein ACYC6N_08935 [Pirellulaceae bacterium]
MVTIATGTIGTPVDLLVAGTRGPLITRDGIIVSTAVWRPERALRTVDTRARASVEFSPPRGTLAARARTRKARPVERRLERATRGEVGARIVGGAWAAAAEVAAGRIWRGSLSVARSGTTCICAHALTIDFAAELADFLQQDVEFCFQGLETWRGGLRCADAELLTLAAPLSSGGFFAGGTVETIRAGT